MEKTRLLYKIKVVRYNKDDDTDRSHKLFFATDLSFNSCLGCIKLTQEYFRTQLCALGQAGQQPCAGLGAPAATEVMQGRTCVPVTDVS